MQAEEDPATTSTTTFLAAPPTSLTLPCLVVEDSPDSDDHAAAASHFSPEPIVMSRGGSCGSFSSSTDDTASGLFCGHRTSGLTTPPRNSSQQQQQQDDKTIVLQANHQMSLSGHNSNHNGDPSSRNMAIASREERMEPSRYSSRSVNKVLLSPLTGAWGWMQKQKEKRRQLYLAELADQQVQILQQAQKSDPNVNFTVGAVDTCLNESTHNSTTGTPRHHDCEEEEDNDDDISWVPPVRCVQEQINKDGPPNPRSWRRGDSLLVSNDPTKPVPFLLDAHQMHDIARYVLPKGIAFCQWKRLYSLTRDGDSFFQCLRLCGSEPKTLLVLKTTRGALLGGYADSEWEVLSHQNGSFHGSAQACLFSFALPPDMPPHHERQPPPSTNVRVFPWTGANRYIQYTDKSENHRMLAFGGGGQEGAFGLCVEQDFQLGSTGPCDTFGNIPLCDQENFNILDLEIWGFLTGQF